jgi:hypothetical protein
MHLELKNSKGEKKVVRNTYLRLSFYEEILSLINSKERACEHTLWIFDRKIKLFWEDTPESILVKLIPSKINVTVFKKGQVDGRFEIWASDLFKLEQVMGSSVEKRNKFKLQVGFKVYIMSKWLRYKEIIENTPV